MESNNEYVVLLTVIGVISVLIFSLYKLFFEGIKVNNDTLRTENDSLKLELEKQKIEFEKSKSKIEQENRNEDKEEENKLRIQEHDKILYNKILNILPSNSNSIILITEKSLNMFPNSDTDDFMKLINKLNGFEDVFLNSILEEKRKILFKEIENFINIMVMKTYPSKNNSSYQCVPKEWDNGQENNIYKETLNELNKQADKTVKSYQNFIKYAKKTIY